MNGYGKDLKMPFELFKEAENGNRLKFDPDSYAAHLDKELTEIFEKAVDI